MNINGSTHNIRILKLEVHTLLDSENEVHKMHMYVIAYTHIAFYSYEL